MADFTVSLSDEKAGAPWGENARLSFTETGAVIHLAQDSDSERAIAQAARKLDGLNLPAGTLTGDWQKEQQWAFALSFTRAPYPGANNWAGKD